MDAAALNAITDPTTLRAMLRSQLAEVAMRDAAIAEHAAVIAGHLTAIAERDHTIRASYIADWLEVLKNDKRCIFKAVALAQRACDWSLAALATYQESRAA